MLREAGGHVEAWTSRVTQQHDPGPGTRGAEPVDDTAEPGDLVIHDIDVQGLAALSERTVTAAVRQHQTSTCSRAMRSMLASRQLAHSG